VNLLLDEHLSPKKIARPLRRAGHDVVAIVEDESARGMRDHELLARAAAEGRILVTRNPKDFTPILRRWSSTDVHHAGCILIWTFRTDQFSSIVKGVLAALAEEPDEAAWRDRAVTI
jgi:predicted nuclease of predicted toxin-antitoxin system